MTTLSYLLLLKVSISNTDLQAYLDDDEKLEYALMFAKNSILARLNSDYVDVPDKYGIQVIEGAKWWLAREGSEGEIANSENGISRTYKDIPDWLSSIPCKVGVVKGAKS